MSFHKLCYFFVLYTVYIFFKLFYRLKVYGRDHIVSGSAIIAPNHVSFFDPPVVAVSCAEEIHFLARQTLFKSFFGKCIAFLNSHPIKKGGTNISTLKQIEHLLNQGKKVLIFPEGKRSIDNHLQGIKPGIGMLIYNSKSVIIPTYIYGTYEVWNCNRKIPKIFGKIAVIFGTPIWGGDYVDIEKKEAQKLIVKHLSHSITKLREWYENGAEGVPP